MKFVIEGADAKTGKDRRIEIDADDEKAAMSQAKATGIYPTSVVTGADLLHSKPSSEPVFSPLGVGLSNTVGAVIAVLTQNSRLSVCIWVIVAIVAIWSIFGGMLWQSFGIWGPLCLLGFDVSFRRGRIRWETVCVSLAILVLWIAMLPGLSQ